MQAHQAVRIQKGKKVETDGQPSIVSIERIEGRDLKGERVIAGDEE